MTQPAVTGGIADGCQIPVAQQTDARYRRRSIAQSERVSKVKWPLGKLTQLRSDPAGGYRRYSRQMPDTVAAASRSERVQRSNGHFGKLIQLRTDRDSGNLRTNRRLTYLSCLNASYSIKLSNGDPDMQLYVICRINVSMQSCSSI